MKNIIIFSDGSSKGNPGPGGWGTIVFADEKVSEFGGSEEHTTNNRMELLGAISGLEHVKDTQKEIILNTDSSYVINGITKWVHGWQKNDWKTKTKDDVLNKDLWKWLLLAVSDKKITWNYVGGHIGVPGNERCDVIANAQADRVTIELFDGKYSDYELDLTNIKGDKTKKKTKSNSKLAAYSYLSLVNGVFHKDTTWAACEKRVKGVKGNVKFKKSTSAEDEKSIMKEWRIA